MTTKHPKRPSGRDSAEYKNFADWTYKNWAWQFLRRNPKFQEACIAANDDSERQAKVASEFYLKRYKPYIEGYEGASGRPLFANSALTLWECPAGDPLVEKVLKIAAGQVLIRFDLSTTVLDEEAIEAQLRTASFIIRNRRNKYLRGMGLRRPPRRTARPSYFLRSLRLLDLMEHMSQGHALSIVNASRKTKMLPAEALDLHGHQIKAAVELSVNGYRHLANLPGKPSPAKFLSTD